MLESKPFEGSPWLRGRSTHADPFLLTTAEIAIAFVGFSAVVVAFRESGGQRLSPFQHLQVRVMIELGFATLFLAAAPLMLSFLELEPATVWRISHAAFGLFLLLYFGNYHARRRPRAEPGSSPVRSPMFIVRIVVTYGLGVLFLMAAAGVLLPAGLALYATGLAWVLALAALAFLIMVTRWGRPSE